MHLQELFNQQKNPSANYKAVDWTKIEITEEELIILKETFARKKAAQINSENYARAVNQPLVYKVPSYIELYEALIQDLTVRLKWEIDEYNELPLKKIACYFSGDSDFELMGDDDNDYSLGKGLLLFGPVGCGKTTVLKVLAKNSFNPYRVVSCRKVASDYADFGHSALSGYSELQSVTKHDWFGHAAIATCFDDLGTEEEKKNFGNQVNVMAEIILNRYDNIEAKNKTFVTTNLTPRDLKEYYGVRALSRMREMFNVIEFPFDGPDRRK